MPAGFYRVNTLVVLGLATFAALVCGTAFAGPRWAPMAAAAVTAWMAGIAWFGERPRVGLLLCGATAALLAGATVLVHQPADGLAGAAGGLLSGLVTGLT
ncbi:MAG: hypothetical protein ACKOTB_08335, partial [Planctomycetia bacterium]